MKPSRLYEALHALIGERVPLHIWGACGVGKSQIVAQVADDLDYEFLDVRAVQLDPVDLRGLPRIKADQAEWIPPKFLPSNGKVILFLDELTSAPQMTQAGCFSVFAGASDNCFSAGLTGASCGIATQLKDATAISKTASLYLEAIMISVLPIRSTACSEGAAN